MCYTLEIKDLEPVRVAYMNYNGLVTDANKVFPNVFKAIRGKSDGAPLFHYKSIDVQTKKGLIELCVPTHVIPLGNGVEIKELPRMKALCVTHIGTYDTLKYAYQAIESYVLENDIQLETDYREVYIKGPGMFFKGNPEKYITEIQFPIKEQIQ